RDALAALFPAPARTSAAGMDGQAWDPLAAVPARHVAANATGAVARSLQQHARVFGQALAQVSDALLAHSATADGQGVVLRFNDFLLLAYRPTDALVARAVQYTFAAVDGDADGVLVLDEVTAALVERDEAERQRARMPSRRERVQRRPDGSLHPTGLDDLDDLALRLQGLLDYDFDGQATLDEFRRACANTPYVLA
ncbi:MAG: hypothetical protein ACK4FW_13255, partial [Stenotrophomonas sp.]